MAMIRGRQLRPKDADPESPISQTEISSKDKPLASLKQQRRLMIGYTKSPEKRLVAIDDPDPYYRDKKTFLVLNKNRLIFRFSEEKSLFLFGRNSKLRIFFINILINKWFNALVITTILVNCLTMMISGNSKPGWVEKYTENIFTIIYSVEAIVKVIGRGFILHRFSYLRDAWNWLDFIVILAAYILIIVGAFLGDSSQIASLTFLRAIRVLRVFKTVSVIPGLRMIVSALIASTKALKDAMLLSLLGFSMFSLVGIQLFRGTLQHKCVLKLPWMLTYGQNCSSNSTEWNYKQCSFEEKYSQIIQENFGQVTYEEMKYLISKQHSQTASSIENYTNFSQPHSQSIATQGATMTFPTYSAPTYAANGSNVLVNSSMNYTEHFDDSGINDACPSNVSSNWEFDVPKNFSFNSTGYSFTYQDWISNEKHYLKTGSDTYQLCGNASSALRCPSYAVCLRVGGNPNFGFTSFDNFPYAFLSVFRLSLQDNWEELYLQILETNGQLAWFFFLAMIFLGSYYLVNLILAVVASSYEDQRKDVENSLEEEKRQLLQEREILKKRRNAALTDFDPNMIRIKSKRNLLANTCSCYTRFKDIFLLWSCCIGNSLLCKLREKLRTFFMHSAAEMTTVTLVILNTFVMALEQEPKDKVLNDFLNTSNTVFTMLFTVEMILKIFALSPYNYFRAGWNIFDFIVVSLSLLEIVIAGEVPDGLSVLRTFRLIRLVRILKLAKSWPTLSKLMRLIADSLSKVGYLTLVLLIVLVIFALAGMQTVGTQFYMNNEQGIPLRWHMHDFPHAFLVVFRIQCGEWIQSMWRCMHSVKEEGSPGLTYVCIFIFLGVVFVGNLVVLNLFLALLLNSFSSDALNNGDGKRRSARELLKSLKKAGKKALPKLPNGVARSSKVTPCKESMPPLYKCSSNFSEIQVNRMKLFNASVPEKQSVRNDMNSKEKMYADSEVISTQSQTTFSDSSNGLQRMSVVNEETKSDLKEVPGMPCKKNDQSCETNHCNCATEHNGHHQSLAKSAMKNDVIKAVLTCDLQKDASYSSSESKNSCCCLDIKSYPTKHVSCKERWRNFRELMNKIVQHNIFETFIIFVITLSSAALVFEDVNLQRKPRLQYILSISDRIFTTIFVIEMIMKWIGFGLKKYFTNGWCLLDFSIVMVSLVSLALEIVAVLTKGSTANLSSLRVLRSLRAFRPLRAMSRFHGIKVVTDALFRSIPSIINVFVICLIFWLVFAIMGVNLFAGKMASCQWKDTGQKVWHPDDFRNYENLSLFYNPSPVKVLNKDDCMCLANFTNGKVEWRNLLINFDNVPIAYVALLQIATFKGWMPIMFAAVDAQSEKNLQPIRDNNIVMYFFFVAFIIFGAFFTLNLFISVVIDNFNQQKKKFELSGGELFLSESQKKAYNAMKKLKTKLPRKLLSVPHAWWRERLYFIVTGDKFELAVLVLTLLNLVAMAVEYEGMSHTQEMALQIISYVFASLFTIEIILRITAMGLAYFSILWNVFDFLIISASLIANVVSVAVTLNDDDGHFTTAVTTSPWLPMLRMIRVVRILRVARVASGIRTLLFALMLSAPALFNVGSLLLLFMFIYAIFGMSQFSHVEKKGAINDVLNFETFPSTFLLLFQMSTSAGWDGFMEPTLYVDGPNARCSSGINGDKRTCMPTSFVGYFYFVSYLLITFVIVTNMYIAIILENFDLATKDNEEELTADDFEHFFDMWQRFDRSGNGRLSVEELSGLLDVLDKPLRIPKPNEDQISSMQIPLCTRYELHIVDVAAALIKKIIGSDGFTKEMEEEVKTYFEKNARSSIATDSGERISDTKQYLEMKKKQQESKKALENKSSGTLAKGICDIFLYDNNIMLPNFNLSKVQHDTKSYHKTSQIVTEVEIHKAWEPEVTLPSSKHDCKSAKLVRSQSAREVSYKRTENKTKRNSAEVILGKKHQRFIKNLHNAFDSSPNLVMQNLANTQKKSLTSLHSHCKHSKSSSVDIDNKNSVQEDLKETNQHFTSTNNQVMTISLHSADTKVVVECESTNSKCVQDSFDKEIYAEQTFINSNGSFC